MPVVRGMAGNANRHNIMVRKRVRVVQSATSHCGLPLFAG
jgi:hypothetical protein